MFTISLLDAPQQEFVTTLMRTNQSRSDIVAIALGRVLAQQAAVPPEPVLSVDAFFSERNLREIEQVLDKVNQLCPINHQQALDYARQFFRFRYDVVHGEVAPVGVPYGTPSFFRLNKHFSLNTIQALETSHAEIGAAVRSFEGILCALKKPQQ